MDEDILFGITEEDQEGVDAHVDTQTEKFLLFSSDSLMFGVPAENVVEVLTSHSITTLPLVPSYIQGIINLRGKIIPILDIRLLLGKWPKDDCCIMILDIDGTSIGILVDEVYRMLDIQKDSIMSVPAHNAQKLVSGMCSLPDEQTMLVFDSYQLLNRS